MKTYTTAQVSFMHMALELALPGVRRCSPNPSVGAVLVADGNVIGSGATERDGGAHAEIVALQSVSAANQHLIPGAQLYVTLEPCSFYGRTPPCADALVQAGIAACHIGCIDFTPGVCGRGLEILRVGGIQVEVGLLQERALALTARRRIFVTAHRPYITLKQAKSADGFVGVRGKKVAITGTLANEESHRWRSSHDAILVGVGTAISDDPSLTTRHVPGPDPLRILLDPNARCPPNQQLLTDGRTTLWAIDKGVDRPQPIGNSVEIVSLDPSQRLSSLMDHLHARRIGSLLVEGGPITLAHFIQADLWDELREWTAHDCDLAGVDAIPAADFPHHRPERVAMGSDTLCITRREITC